MPTAFARRAGRGTLKRVADALDDRLLGAPLIGAEIVQRRAVAPMRGANPRELERQGAVPPAAAEAFMLVQASVRRMAPAPAAGRTR